MTIVDIEAIRARSDVSVEVGPVITGQVITAAVLTAHWESAQDVPALLAEIERLQNILDDVTDQHAPKGGGQHG